MEIKRKPDWLKVRVQSGADRAEVEALLGSLSLNTVCEQASCPNLMECYSRRTATFMILGCTCTRNCTFCDVSKGIPSLVDEKEPENVAVAVKKLMLKHAVITSVTRDDLEDGGAQHFAEVIREIRKTTPNVTIEVLIPDFKGDINALQKVVNAKPDIINHNVETVPRLYGYVRPMAIYERSLQLLANVKEIDLDLSNVKKLDLDLANVKKLDSSIYTKSGIMVGLGETQDEVIEVMKDLRKVRCDILTVGQYLSPSSKHHEVIEYVHPDIFEFYKSEGEKMGFRYVASGPLVRSSYHADKALEIE